MCFFFLHEREREREREKSRTLNTKSFRLESIIRSPIVNRTLIAGLRERSYSFGPTFAAIDAESQTAEASGKRSIRRFDKPTTRRSIHFRPSAAKKMATRRVPLGIFPRGALRFRLSF